MPLPGTSLSDRMYNAALKVALEPFLDIKVEFVPSKPLDQYAKWTARLGKTIATVQIRTDGRGMSNLYLTDRDKHVMTAGFNDGEGWADLFIAGQKVSTALADADVLAWVADLERAAKASDGQAFTFEATRASA